MTCAVCAADIKLQQLDSGPAIECACPLGGKHLHVSATVTTAGIKSLRARAGRALLGPARRRAVGGAPGIASPRAAPRPPPPPPSDPAPPPPSPRSRLSALSSDRAPATRGPAVAWGPQRSGARRRRGTATRPRPQPQHPARARRCSEQCASHCSGCLIAWWRRMTPHEGRAARRSRR